MNRIATMIRLLALCAIFLASTSPVLAGEKPEIFVQLGHSDAVSSIAVSTDGMYALSGSEDKTLKLWEVATGREVRTFIGHTGRVLSVALSADGRYALSGSQDQTLRLWDVATGREVRTCAVEGFLNWIHSIALSHDGRYALSGASDTTPKLWDVVTGREVRTFTGHKKDPQKNFGDWVTSVALSPDGRYALSAITNSNAFNLWEIATGREIRVFTGHTDTINAVAFSRDGRYALSGSRDNTVRFWDISTGSEIRIFRGHTSAVFSVAFSPDGRYALSGSYDQTARLWDTSTGREVKTFGGHKMSVNAVAFMPDGRSALSGSTDRTLKLWDISTGKEIRAFSSHIVSVKSIAISPNGSYLLVGAGQTLELWDLATGRRIRQFTGHTSEITSVSFSPDGRYALAVSWKTFKLWELATGKEIRQFTGHSSQVTSVSFSPDGRYALSGSSDQTVKLWDVSTGEAIKTFAGHKLEVTSVSFSPDGRYALSGGWDGLKLWDIAAGKEIRTFEGVYWDYSVAFSPDGRFAVSGGKYFKSVKLWEVATGKKIWTFEGHANEIRSTVFSFSGRYILSGSLDNTLKLLNAETGKEIRTFEGHTYTVASVAFSPDERHVLSGSHDGTTRFWDTSTGKEIAQFISFPDNEWIVITPEGYFSASPNGAKHLNVRVGSNIYAIDQFYTKFYRPELVQLALAGKELPKGESLTDVLAKKPAPLIQIMSPQSGTVDEDMITLSVKATDNGGGIGSIHIYLNGTQVSNDARGVIVKGKDAANEKILTFTIPLIQGQNEIRAIAFNKEGSMESTPAAINITSKAIVQKPDLYAIVVGINEYKNKSISLTYAVPDARAFAEILKKSALPLFGKIQIRLLTTFEETTKESIPRVFEETRGKIKPNDLFVFYNASHGIVDVVDEEEQYFLLTSNVLLLSSRHIGKDAMSHKELAKLIGNIPAQKKIVILDTCNAGKGGKEIQIALLQQTRGLTESTAVKVLQRAIGSAVFSASSDTQQALEGYKGHGLFTYVLMEGLQGKADIKKEGFITIYGLADYVGEQVLKLSEEVFKRQQTPTIQTGGDFPIGRIQ
jgi:WD40 repeat protein